MFYKIIQDEEKLLEFIEWLPDISKDECYYLTLFARKKYDSSIKSDKAQLKTIITNKERMLSKIKQLETKIGTYTLNDVPVTQKSLVLYITTPRSHSEANRKLTKNIIDNLFKGISINPYKESLRCLQTAKSLSNKLLLFDIDDNNFDVKSIYLNDDSYSIVKTRGGYRIIVYSTKVDWIFKKSFYMKLSNISDQTGDLFIPVVGCTQGGFTPYFIKK